MSKNKGKMDAEVSALHTTYETLSALDRKAQERCLEWLTERLWSDEQTTKEAVGEAKGI